MKIVLTTLNAKYIHKNLALRWLYVSNIYQYSTKIFEYTIKDDLNRITDELQDYNPDIIGISVYIWNGCYINEFTRLLKEKLPNCKIVLGGPEVSYEYQSYLTDNVDAILLGEGEQSFWQYVNGEREFEGLVTHNYENKVIRKVDLAFLETLESPYFLDFDMAEMGNRYFYLEASRGCPYSCAYCQASLDNHLRYFSLEYLFKILDRLNETNVKQVKFLDRTFNAHKERSLRIVEKIVSLRKDVSFQTEVMADTLSEELMSFLCEHHERFRLEVGIQSFNLDALKAVGRRSDLDKLVNNVQLLRKNNVVVHCDLIGGLPFEDLNSFKQTYQRLWSLDTDEMQVGILKLLKGTRIKNEIEKYHIEYENNSPFQIIKNDWVNKDDIEKIEYVALATEKLWNRNLCRNSLWHLYQKGTYMFDCMMEMGIKISKLSKPYQPHQLFKIVSEYLDDDGINVLRNDYYRLFKQRPVRFIECNLEKNQKHEIFDCLVNEGLLTNDDLRYCMFDFDINGYQIMLYNSSQLYPMRYYVSKELVYIGKEDLNERYYDCHLK